MSSPGASVQKMQIREFIEEVSTPGAIWHKVSIRQSAIFSVSLEQLDFKLVVRD